MSIAVEDTSRVLSEKRRTINMLQQTQQYLLTLVYHQFGCESKRRPFCMSFVAIDPTAFVSGAVFGLGSLLNTSPSTDTTWRYSQSVRENEAGKTQ